MKTLDARIVDGLRAGAGDFAALRVAIGCTAPDLKAGIQRLRWAGKIEMGALRLAPSMIDNSAEEAAKKPPPGIPAESGPAQRRRAQDGAEAVNSPASAPNIQHNSLGAAALERARGRTAASVPARPAQREIAAEVREEAEVRAARRRAARATGGGQRPLTLSATETVATLMVEEPADAIRAVTRKWPGLWQSVVLRAREENERPGLMLFKLIERGLEASNG